MPIVFHIIDHAPRLERIIVMDLRIEVFYFKIPINNMYLILTYLIQPVNKHREPLSPRYNRDPKKKTVHHIISKGDHRGRFLWEPDFSFTDVMCVPCSPYTLTKKKLERVIRLLINYINNFILKCLLWQIPSSD